MSPEDEDVRWFENKTIYKSWSFVIAASIRGIPSLCIITLREILLDYESIAMAVSDDMVTWKRYGENPVITRGKGICGDAQIAKIGNIYVMFYFGALWKSRCF